MSRIVRITAGLGRIGRIYARMVPIWLELQVLEMRRSPQTAVAAAIFLGCIVGANWAVSTFGIVPVGFGLMAPAAVFFVGVTFTARDFLGTRSRTVVLILLGAALSALLADPRIAVASGAAFLFSELSDLAVYYRLRVRRGWVAAVVASNTVGAVVDSAIFLTLAFGSLDFLAGQVVGKLYMTAAAVPVIAALRARRRAFVWVVRPPWVDEIGRR